MVKKLNIGSGYPKEQYFESEWVNIDDAPEGTFDDKSGVIKMSVLEMPEDWSDSFGLIHCVHVLEHINRNLREKVVEQIYRVTAPGGVAYIEVPDFETIVHLLSQSMQTTNYKREHQFTTSIFGKQRYTGDAHCWGYTQRTLKELCGKAGFNSVVVNASIIKNQFIKDSNFNAISNHHLQEPVLLAECTK